MCVNEIDLADSIDECRQALRPYLELGYRVPLASALSGAGIAELRTGAVSERHHAGKHTTTQVNLWKLELGGSVVDTPGIREFGLSGLRKADLAQHYPEIVALGLDCRFADCTHTDEPDCAVRAGVVSAARYRNYLRILAELPE